MTAPTEDAHAEGCIHITWGPTKLLKTERMPERWCFRCRKRLEGEMRLMGDDFPSYYDPNWGYHCDGCNGDHRLFPGWGWSDDL